MHLLYFDVMTVCNYYDISVFFLYFMLVQTTHRCMKETRVQHNYRSMFKTKKQNQSNMLVNLKSPQGAHKTWKLPIFLIAFAFDFFRFIKHHALDHSFKQFKIVIRARAHINLTSQSLIIHGESLCLNINKLHLQFKMKSRSACFCIVQTADTNCKMTMLRLCTFCSCF